ncbi:MAG: 7-cyano-7-deazaguanine synthase [Candidatus Melainabacteria bacterium]|nr:7-cyano-7-deazaguanine synthase [Candidatus Melainabacteria bacterium]
MLTSSIANVVSLPSDLPRSAVAVLTSGGISSAVLLAQALDHFEAVYPIYGQFGLPWQTVEEQHLRRFLAAMRGPGLGRLKVLELPVDDIYKEDGTIAAQLVPESTEPEELLTLSGRNVLLLSKASVWSVVNGIEVLATGPQPEHRLHNESHKVIQQIKSIVRAGLKQSITVVDPLSQLSKCQVVALGRDLPLEFTFSCISPVHKGEFGSVHCGRCHKCIERQLVFAENSIQDRTRYATAELLAGTMI